MIKLKYLLYESVIDSPEFKRWFGKSKVTKYIPDLRIDIPKVVYHATSTPHFTKFDKEKIGSSTDGGYLGAGFYFSSYPNDIYAGSYHEKDIDGKYIQKYKDSGRVYPAFLRIENPVPDKELDYAVEMWNDNPNLMTKYFKEKGYDGVIGSGEYVVFEPDQIKSAIGNAGKFDINDPDITKESN